MKLKRICSLFAVLLMLLSVMTPLFTITSFAVTSSAEKIDWASADGWTVDGDSFSKGSGTSVRISSTAKDGVDLTGSLTFTSDSASDAGIAVYAPSDYTPHVNGYNINWDFTSGVKQVSVIANSAFLVSPVAITITQNTALPFRILAKDGRLQVWCGDLTGDPVIDTEIDTSTPGYIGAYGHGGACTFTDVVLAAEAEVPTDEPVDWTGETGWTVDGDSFSKGSGTAVRVSETTRDGVDLTGSLTFTSDSASDAGIAVYAPSAYTPHVNGYNINWDFTSGAKQVSVITNSAFLVSPVAITITKDTALPFRILAKDGRLRVWCGDLTGDPVIDTEIDTTTPGYIGAYGHGGACTFTNVRVATGGSSESDLRLSAIYINGTEVKNFSTANDVTVIPVPTGTTSYGTVTANSKDSAADVKITQATALNPEAVITVTGSDGKSVKNYTVQFAEASTNIADWQALKAGWHMEGTTIVGDGAGSNDTHAYSLLSLMSNTTAGDFSISADIKLGADGAGQGNDASQGGFIIRAEDPNTYGFEKSYAVMMHYNPNYGGTGKVYNEIAVWRFDNNVNASVIAQTTDVALSLGTSYNLKVIARNGRILVYLDGTKALEVEDSLHATGRVGLFRNGVDLGKRVTFSNIQLKDAPSDDALLKELKVNGNQLPDFSAHKFSYSSRADDLAQLPVVAATANAEGASVVIEQATEQTKKATVTVTAPDGETVKIYSVSFRQSLPAGIMTLCGPVGNGTVGTALTVALTAAEVNILTGVDVVIDFDPEYLQFAGVKLSEAMQHGENTAVLDYVLTSGSVHVAASQLGANALMQDSDVLILTFMPLREGTTNAILKAGSEIGNIFAETEILAADVTEEIRIGTQAPPAVVDKSALEVLINANSSRIESDYTTSSWNVFSSAFTAAQNELTLQSATQESVNAAADALQGAINGLRTRPRDYSITILSSANGTITSDKQMAASGETVTLTVLPSEGYRLKAIFSNGIRLIANSFAMPDENVELQAVFEQIAGEPEAADKSSLTELTNQTLKLTSAGYTEKSWKLVSDALEKAQSILQKSDATQSEIDSAFNALKSAVNSLIKYGESEPGNPETGITDTGIPGWIWVVCACSLTGILLVLLFPLFARKREKNE